ncbi:hypothetical protein J2Z60_002001 [Lactobacillus colini]|uniref:Uncharacterized protein n=1 Tax=Lactobacillus colini TaxID=1819254 RepID=A0ABS4MGJ0_9LACO|nr:hypothetical protein [Lactobacillus colini]MBP2058810.1 hypothetical protein [Lactobacillus colini]
MMHTKLHLKRTHFIGYALILIQTILLLFVTTTFLAIRYENQWKDYLNNQTSYNIYLNNIQNDKRDEVISYLKSEADSKKFLLLRKQYLNNKFILGVYGDISSINTDFYYDHQQLISKNNLSQLLHSSNIHATLGLGNGSINQIAPIYKAPLGDQIVIFQLDEYNHLTKSIRGQYQLVGLSSDKEYNSLVNSIAKITGQPKNNFIEIHGGESQDNTLLSSFLIFGILITSLGIFAFLFIDLLSSLKEFGTLILLGWSKKTILFNKFIPFLGFSIGLGISLDLILSFYLGKQFFIYFVYYLTLAIILGIILLIIIYLTAALLIISLKNISLIKNRYPKSVLYTFIMLFYIIISSILVIVGTYIDGPTESIIANAQQAAQWQKVENMEVLKKSSPGSDGIRSISDPSSDIYKDTLNFYKDIANKQGVYLISSFYGSEDWLSNRSLYKRMPTKPFTILTTSPNYLQKINFHISSSALRQAKQGKRVFYIPDTYSSKQQINLRIFLKDFVTDGITKSDIQTTFSKHKQLILIPYHPKKEIFLWNNDSTEPTHSRNPIIDIVTPANMTYVDIGNIQGPGLDSNLKFESKKIVHKIITPKRLIKYHLDDNKLEYTTISNYIDGEQKSLWQTITMFSIVLLFLVIILSLLIIVLAMFYRNINQEKIAVKKFLGFTFWQIYNVPLLIISVVAFVELIVILIVRSKIGIPLVLLNFLVQLTVFYIYLSRTQFSKIIELFKGE